jgi:hypothetical protein
MRLQVSKTRALTAVSAAAVTAVFSLGLTEAIAAVAGHGVASFDKCGLQLTRCGTPLVYRPAHKHLGLQASAKRAGAPLVIQEEDYGQPLQEWMYIPVGRMNQLSRTISQRMGVTAYDLRHYRSAWLVRLELTPGGRESGWCATNMDRELVLERCNRAVNQTFIQSRTANGVRAIVGYFGLSMLQAQVPGHHVTATGSYRRGTQVVFRIARNRDVQYWYELPRHRKSPKPTSTTPTHHPSTPVTTPPVPNAGYAG